MDKPSSPSGSSSSESISASSPSPSPPSRILTATPPIKRLMEPINGKHNKAYKFSPEEKDVISSMPDNVITNILHCLPIQDVVKTSLLSRNWRYKWTTMCTHAVFDTNFFEYLLETTYGIYYGSIFISKVLLRLKGGITKFVLLVPKESDTYHEFLDPWVKLLLMKGIEDFTLSNFSETPLMLPTALFYCTKLKHLMLEDCWLPPLPILRGFPNLLSLHLFEVRFILQSYTCGEFLTLSPLLENVKINGNCVTGVMKRDEISKLENLKVISFPLCKLESTSMITCSNVFELTGNFSKVEKLTLDFLNCKFLTDGEKSVMTPLPSVKMLELYDIDYSTDIMVSCAIELICGFPNLETLLIISACDDTVPLPANSSKVDFSRIGQLQLRDVKLQFVRGFENEVYMIKSLLASSPWLKKMTINANTSQVFGGNHGMRVFAAKLLKFHRASPIAEVDLDWFGTYFISRLGIQGEEMEKLMGSLHERRALQERFGI